MESGTRLGPYEVQEQLGAGGMGEVYLALDTRLGRKVALKVLPEEFASDPQRLARFEQEARAAAALNHPHIAAVHDVGESGGTHFMVQEHLEGESLDRVLEHQEMPIDRVLQLGLEIVEGLIAAHSAGIVHRDLKPANVFVTEQGHAKVLDFGLAKLISPDVADTEAATVLGSMKSPTALGTTAGQIMGTAGYMAPEQVSGAPDIDRRADLFSFGCLLYEAASGRRPFRGENLIEILHAISNRAPKSLAEIAPRVPVELDRIVTKCLAKRREDRYQHADDLAVDLRALCRLVETGEAVTHTNAAAGRIPEQETQRWPWVLAVVAAGVFGIGATAMWMSEDVEPAPSYRFVVEVSESSDVIAAESGRGVAISDDGTLLAMEDRGLNPFIQHWLRPLGSLEIERLQTGNAIDLKFSPDNRFLASIAYFGGDHGLMVQSRQGGDAALLSRVTQGFHWREDGSILFAAEDALWTAGADGSEPTKLVDLSGDGETTELWDPVWLPGEKAVLMVRAGRQAGPRGTSIVAVSLESGEVLAELIRNAVAPIYADSGHLLYAKASQRDLSEEGLTLMAVAFDAKALEIQSEPVVLQAGIGFGTTTFPVGQVALSRSGTLAYAPHRRVPPTSHTIVRIRPGGGVDDLLSDQAVSMSRPRLSPGEARVALEVLDGEGERDIWVYDLARAGARLKLTGEGRDYDPVWSNDGGFIAYSSDRTGREQMYVKRSDGGGAESPLLSGDLDFNAHTWHPDGETLSYYSRADSRQRDIGILHTAEDPPRAEPFIQTEFNERGPAFSPDGRWIAYASDRSGRDEVYVTDYPGQDVVEPVSLGGGREPVWSADGQAMYYRSGDDFYRVEMTASPALTLSEPELVASGAYVTEVVPRSGSLSYDVMDDGSIVAVRREAAEAEPAKVIVVTNFFTELQRLVPAR